MLTACRSYCFQKVVVLLTRVRFWAICLVVLELATRKTSSFIFYRFFLSWARNGFKFASGAWNLFNIFFPLGVWTIFFVFFSCFWTIQKIVSSFCSYKFGWCAVLVLEPFLLCGNMVTFNFLGRCFRSKKKKCFLELWFLKLRFCKFRSLWTNIDPSLLSIIVETPLFRVWETFKKYLWAVLFPVWKPSRKYCFFLSFLIFFELYDAPLFQVLEPSAKYTVPFFWGTIIFDAVLP